MTNPERRIAAIVFTDIVGFSALSQENEALALELLNEHFGLLRPLISQHNGNEIKTIGDSFMIEFASPLNAVECAIAFQRALHIRNIDEPQERKILIRIGIHLGDVQHQDGDVFGDGVNIASRIEPLAEPGGIAITRQVYDQVHNKIDWELKSLGAPQLKNITTVVEIFKVDLNWDAGPSHAKPKVESQKLDQRLKIGSVIAVGVIAVAALFILAQSILAPDEVHLEPGEITSIAVLPFQDLSEAQDQEYFSEGLADEMRNALVKIDGLRVPSYTSSTSNRLEELSLKEIADLMNVEAVLEGTVRKSGDRLRITAQFIRASDDRQLWSETFDRESGDIFEIQEEIAEAIVQKLGFQTPPNQQIVEFGTENAEAYNLYIQGRHLWSKRTEEAMATAIEYFTRARELDSNYAQAYVGLADAYDQSSRRGFLSQDYLAQAEELAKRALEINPNLAEAYATLGNMAMNNRNDFEAAETLLLKSIELDPNYPSAHHWYRILLSNLGRRDEAFRHARIAKELDPLSPIILHNYAVQLYLLKDFENALIELEMVFRLEPEFANNYFIFSLVKLYLGEAKEAEDRYIEAIERFPDNHIHYRNLGFHYLLLGKFEEAEIQLQKSIDLADVQLTAKHWMALLLNVSGRSSAAIDYLATLLIDDGDSTNFSTDLALAYYYASDFSKALGVIESRLQMLDPSASSTRALLLSYQGAVYGKMGDSAGAIRLISQLENEDLLNPNTPLNIAIIYAGLGDSENTLLWLERAYDLPASDWAMINVLPDFAPYRDQPGFREFFERMDMERNDP